MRNVHKEITEKTALVSAASAASRAVETIILLPEEY
jgi:hypothetical protein